MEKVDDTTVDFQVADGAAYFTLGNSAVFVRMYPKHIWEGIEDPLRLHRRGCCHRLRPL